MLNSSESIIAGKLSTDRCHSWNCVVSGTFMETFMETFMATFMATFMESCLRKQE